MWEFMRVIYKAVAVKGKQIFWAVDKNHPRNKGYQWKWFASWLNGKTILILLLSLLNFSCERGKNHIKDLGNIISEKPFVSAKYNSIDTVYALKQGYSLLISINQVNNDCILKLSKDSSINRIVDEYTFNQTFFNVYDFNYCFAITSKIGSNIYFSLYSKTEDKIIIKESIPYVLDEEHQIILYDEMNCDSLNEDYIDVKDKESADFSLYDIVKDKKQFVIKPFRDCQDPYYGSIGSYNDICIKKVDDSHIYIQYNHCKTLIKR